MVSIASAATRQEIQAALDLIRFTNVEQDLFNNYSKIARGEVQKVTGDIGNQVKENMTVDDIKSTVTRGMENIDNYNTMITSYLSDPAKQQQAQNGLTALGVTLKSITDDLQIMKAKLDAVKPAVSVATTSTQLSAIGNGIDQDIPQLSLVRNK